MVIEPESRSAADDRIVRAAIFPSIGVARVGSSKTEWFLGPEVPEPLPLPPGSYRDATGALKRQAAHFRVYGLNAADRVVRELTTEDSQIEWTVELANKKSGWYGFQLALDITEASSAPPTTPRNPLVSDRKSLLIRPRARTISGADQPQQHFDDGTFMGAPVYLGSILTDDAGRLVVLGGHGVSTSYNNSPAVTFANNDTWCDDTSDGPVTAKVKVGGNILPVDPAWIVVGPPNYAPCRKSVRSMWDLMRDLAIQGLMLKRRNAHRSLTRFFRSFSDWPACNGSIKASQRGSGGRGCLTSPSRSSSAWPRPASRTRRGERLSSISSGRSARPRAKRLTVGLLCPGPGFTATP